MAIGGADRDGAMYEIDLNIPDVDALQSGQPHQANATFDGDIDSFYDPSQPWLAALFTKRVPQGIGLSKTMILIDSACTVHIVTKSWLLDDCVTISPEKIQWGNSQHVMLARGKGTLVTRNMLLDGSTRVTTSSLVIRSCFGSLV